MGPLFVALAGLCAGVLVEGVVSSYRYNETLWPWPRCRGCGRVFSAVASVPVLGLWLRAGSSCRGHDAWRRGLCIEAATALTFYLLGAQYWGHPLLLLVSLLESSLLVAVMFIDIELRLIPTLLVVLLVGLALASASSWPGLGLWSAVAGGAIGYATFGALVLIAQRLFGDGAFGLGDANLALAIGCITGYPSVAAALSAGVFLGGIGALFVVTIGRRGLRSTIPYGPFLVVGVLYVLAHGNTLSPLVRL